MAACAVGLELSSANASQISVGIGGPEPEFRVAALRVHRSKDLHALGDDRLVRRRKIHQHPQSAEPSCCSPAVEPSGAAAGSAGSPPAAESRGRGDQDHGDKGRHAGCREGGEGQVQSPVGVALSWPEMLR